MAQLASPRRVLVSHAAPTAFAPMTRPILAKLGYRILDAEEFALELEKDEYARPDLRLVDERHLGEVDHDDPVIPIVALTGREGVTGADPRIVAALRRPAGLHALFRILQQLLEDQPRSSPRVSTHLRSRCEQAEREWGATVLCLSENGCLLRSAQAMPLGSRLRLRLQLPRHGDLQLAGDVAYQLLPDLGVVFNGSTSREREVLASFVREALGTP